MAKTPLTTQEANKYLGALKSVPLAKVWRGFGSYLFLEFGDLNAEEKGVYTLAAGTEWRLLLKDKDISSRSEWVETDQYLTNLAGNQLHNVHIDSKELELTFDEFRLIVQMNDFANDTWSFNSENFEGFLSCKNGALVIEKEG